MLSILNPARHVLPNPDPVKQKQKSKERYMGTAMVRGTYERKVFVEDSTFALRNVKLKLKCLTNI